MGKRESEDVVCIVTKNDRRTVEDQQSEKVDPGLSQGPGAGQK